MNKIQLHSPAWLGEELPLQCAPPSPADVEVRREFGKVSPGSAGQEGQDPPRQATRAAAGHQRQGMAS